ncbi:MAG: 50S ribosome-binding GTPase [Synergistaceae bacterium]|nr:50S ribosome-binding GTPase [Synergistaceae bacterium]
MIKFSEWEHNNFREYSNEPGLTVVFPSREIYFSSQLLRLMRLENSTCPKTLDQWYELCHPSDHMKISKIEEFIYNSHENFFSLTRKLYCGDGVYRNFMLDAFIQRYADGKPAKLYGNEILSLNAWLAEADDGDKIELNDDLGRVRILEATRVAGTMILKDLSVIEDLERENLILRHEISRRIFSPFPTPLKILRDSGREDFIFDLLNENLDAAINILPANAQLRALKNSLNSSCLNIAVMGLSGSGKSTLINAFTGEKINVKDVPVAYREGEKKVAKVFYSDGHVIELGVRSDELGNTNKAAQIEISIPGALIPEGICLIDMPGWDALKGQGTCKNVLPELDFIIYILPVRSRLKGSDYKLLEELKSHGDKIIFALSKIDLENSDTEAGQLIRTPEEKISSDIDAIKNEIKNFNGLDVEIIPVSAKIAAENFFSRNSDAWKNSNIESIINIVKNFSENLREKTLILRAGRVLKILENSRTEQRQLEPIINNLKELGIRNEDLGIKSREVKKFNFNFPHVTQEKHLLSSLITSMREHGFKGRFFSLGAFEGQRRAVLLGAERSMSMKLFARLSHNLRLEIQESSNENEWLFAGQNLPSRPSMPFDCKKLESQAFAKDENILIAPPDYLLKEDFNRKKFFNDYTPVVSVDLARLESGLSDLIFAPYAPMLARSKWILAFPNAALLSEDSSVSIEDLKIGIKNFCETNGLKVPDIFIFENYTIF